MQLKKTLTKNLVMTKKDDENFKNSTKYSICDDSDVYALLK